MPDYRIAVWCAVSSKPQAEKYSLDEQERLGREFCAQVGGRLCRVYRVAHSRDIILFEDAARQIPAYRQLREDLDADRIDILWCFDIDRLGRDPALQQAVISLVEKGAGGEVYHHSAPHIIGQKSLGHRYVESSMGVRAAEEQQIRVRRHRMGMQGRVRSGLHSSHWPTGYRCVRDARGRAIGADFEPVIGAVRLASEMFLRGESYNTIVQALNASPWKPRRGERWWLSTIRQILNNDTYAGLVKFDEAHNAEPSPHFPALWDRDTHAAMLRERERRRNGTPLHPNSGRLRGVCFCNRCGGAMSYSRKKTQVGHYTYLRCTRHVKGSSCHGNYTQESYLLDELGAWLRERIDPSTITEALEERSELGAYEVEIRQLDKRILQLGEQRTRLAVLASESSMSPDVYSAADAELLQELEASRARASELELLLASEPSIEERRAALEHLVENLADRLHEAPAEIVRGALLRAGIRVYCEERRVAPHGIGFK